VRAMRRMLWIAPLLLSLTACHKQEFGPTETPAAEHPVYAREFPARLTAFTELYNLEHNATKEFLEKLKTFPAPVQGTSWVLVKKTYELAEADGKSAHYAHMRGENAALAAFVAEEKKEVVKKISGSVQYQAKQDHCQSQFHGAIDSSFDKGIAERFDARRENSSQSQLFISENEEKLGKDNIKALRQQADAIATASYLVHVLLAEHHVQLSGHVKEAKTVGNTLSDRLDELEAARHSGETDSEKAARNLEQEQLFTARAELEHALAGAKERLATSEQDVQSARDAFKAAMEQLLKDVDSRG